MSMQLHVGTRDVEADFRSCIGRRVDPAGPAMAYRSPLGLGFDVLCAAHADVDRAVELARRATAAWRAMAPLARRSVLMTFADAIDAAAAELGALDCLDMGKPITTAEQEAHIAAFIVRWYAECIDKAGGFVAPSAAAALAYSERVPYGVIGAVTSWNYPVINAAMKIGPALAAGNAIVLKPSEHAPLSALRLGDLALAAGVPPGVVNVIFGGGDLGAALCSHPDVDMVAFTGSTPTGIRAATAAAQHLKPVIVECGGKNPILVADDVDDVAAIVADVIKEAFANTGQLCVARSKLIVPRSLRSAFIDALAAQLPAMRSGDPADAATTYGPLAYAQHALSVRSGIDAALASGAQVLQDGFAGNAAALHCGATLLEATATAEQSMSHEYFGPVLTLYAYDKLDEAVAAANAGGYGLAATAWTRDLRRARWLTQRLRAGQVIVRAAPGLDAGAQMALPVEPAGRSGYGVEFGIQALESYSRRQAVQLLGLDACEGVGA